MIKICILTATRAEYGLLRPVIYRLTEEPRFDVRIVVTGTHLSPEFGLTYKDIEHDGILIDEQIEILLSSDTPASISKSMGLAMIGFADYFARAKPDLLLVLGDRYETLAVCCAAMNARIPIAHLYGGESTEGAVDEVIRHAITKLSYLHFTSTEEYRKRVIQLGEDPKRVFCVGALGVENALRTKLLTKEELAHELGFSIEKPYAVVTFHPVTLEEGQSKEQFGALLSALSTQSALQFIFTKSNADVEGRIINKMIDTFVAEREESIAFASLGTRRYLSALKYSTMVIGNSSSGLVEAPSFGIPTINIGDRQKGRAQATSVINCEPLRQNISEAIELALTSDFRAKAKVTINPYGDGNASVRIAEVINDSMLNDRIDLKKSFYDWK